MNNLLVLRERFKQFMVSHSLLVRKGAQFCLALLVFNLINSNIGFMKVAFHLSLYCWLSSSLYISPSGSYDGSSNRVNSGSFIYIIYANSRSYGDTVFVNVYFLLSIYPEKSWLFC